MHRYFWTCLVMLAACDAPTPSIAPGAYLPEDRDDDPAEHDDDDVQATQCDAQVTWVDPATDAQNVRVDATIAVGFSAPLPESRDDWSVIIDEAPGTVEVSPDRRSVTVFPDAPLAHDTPYTVRTDVCGRRKTHGFRTVQAAIPLDAIDGTSWFVETDYVEWLAPSTTATFVPNLSLPNFLIGVVEEDDGLHLIARPAVMAGQLMPMPCGPTIDLGLLDLTNNPQFETVEDDAVFSWFGTDLSIDGVRASGTFGNGGATIREVSLEAQFDTRDIESLTFQQGLCATMAAAGDACVPCADGTPACLDVYVTYDGAGSVSNDAYDAPFDPFNICD